jgi:formylglycine-generating enzyme required for sulfatase activity
MRCKHTARPSLRPIAWVLLVTGGTGFLPAEENPSGGEAYPLWDGKETVEEYATRVKLEPAIVLDLGDGVKMDLVLIPAGKFVMGLLEDVEGRPAEGGTQHDVTIGTPFYMGRFEVTQEQYEQVMDYNPSRFKSARNPVENISWNVAQEFCKTLGRQCGRTIRLPSEAEWEYACRAGSKTRFHPASERHKPQPLNDDLRRRVTELIDRLGSDEFTARDQATRDLIALGREILPLLEKVRTDDAEVRSRLAVVKASFRPKSDVLRVAWCRKNSANKHHPVGEKEPNRFGLYDMHGNVSEWCEDDWHDSFVGAPNDGSPWVDSPRAEKHVVRGGSWFDAPEGCCATDRDECGRESRRGRYGLRVVAPARTP